MYNFGFVISKISYYRTINSVVKSLLRGKNRYNVPCLVTVIVLLSKANFTRVAVRNIASVESGK